jgi:hypothetical protein
VQQRDDVNVYEEPRLYELGQVTNLTLGHGGSTLDGNCRINQLGGGNDDQEDGGPNSCS